MYNEMINSRVTVMVSSRGENVLEYVGVLIKENDESIVLANVDISYLILSIQKGLFGNGLNVYKQGVDKVVINKRYIISCNN
jgi:hypothetical protein